MRLELINFVDMSLDEKKMVLEWRNHPNIRKYMYNRYTISLEEHLNTLSPKNAKIRDTFSKGEDENYIGVYGLLRSLDLDRGWKPHFWNICQTQFKGGWKYPNADYFGLCFQSNGHKNH